MKVLGNRIFIKRGESFTLKFGDTEYTQPLVFTSAMRNPFIVISIKSTTYPQIGAYKYVKWLNCKRVIRFQDAKILYLGTGNMNTVPLPDEVTNKRVYSITDDTTGELVYFYNDSTGRKQYNFKFKVHYSNDEIDNMVDNEYVVNVFLVDGETLATKLKQLRKKYNLTFNGNNMSDNYQALKNIGAPELQTLDLDVPLSSLTLNIPLSQFKIYVEV